MKKLAVIFFAFFAIAFSKAEDEAKLIQVEWPTRHAADPPGDAESAQVFGLAKAVLDVAPDELGWLANGGGQLGALALGLPAEQANELGKTLTDYAAKLKKNPTFANAASALPYCFSAKKPAHGLASIYLPKKVDATTRRIVFVHGYGGSFITQFAMVIEAFPDAILIAPAHGISGGNMPRAYVSEALDAMSRLLKIENFQDRPLLIGLSAGGIGGFEMFRQAPEKFAGFICLAAYPQRQFVIPRQSVVRVLCGAEEWFVKDGTLHRQVQFLRRVDFEIKLVGEAGHFFLLTRPEETKKILRDWAKTIFTK